VARKLQACIRRFCKLLHDFNVMKHAIYMFIGFMFCPLILKRDIWYEENCFCNILWIHRSFSHLIKLVSVYHS
jgi:hypothetical protein